MQVLETDRAKSLIPERLVEIEEFELHAKAILAGYLRSLETAKNTEARVRENFVHDLLKKDKRIAELEEVIEQRNLAVKEIEAKVTSAVALTKKAETEAEQAKKLQIAAEKTAADKVAMAEMFQKQLKEATDKLDDYPVLKEQNDALSKELVDQERAYERKFTALEIELSKATAVVEEKSKQSARIEEQHKMEIERLNDKLDHFREEKDALKEEYLLLKSDNNYLRKRIAELEPKAPENM